MSQELEKAKATIAALTKAGDNLRTVCQESVEYSDWPELQKAVEDWDNTLDETGEGQ